MAKKIILGLLGALAIAVVCVLGVAATKPDSSHLERTIEISAPRLTVMPLVGDFRNWPRWSPWLRLDPHQRTTFGDSTFGVGATYAWSGNSDVGKGGMEITGIEEDADSMVITYRLDFIEPFQSTNVTKMELTDLPGGKTRLTWSMDAPLTFPMKIMHTLVDMDAMVGADFERGLASIARLARGAPRPNP
jgi:hypothetical protein